MKNENKYAWREGMGEISGFGGTYEEACRRMFFAGLEWLDANPDAEPRFKGFKGVFGLIDEDNEAAKQLSESILAEVPGCSGAMHHVAIKHCLIVRANGWEEYCKQMSSQKEEKA